MGPEFCTLFDGNYLPRGLALYESLKRYAPDARLRVFCMDEVAERILEGLALPDLTVISLAELERHDPELASAKSDRYEDGKLGDQKYLDDWPQRFDGVSVLEHVGGGVAPWNVTNYTVHERGGRPWVDDVPVIFFHFHSLDLFRPAARHLRSAVVTGM